VMYADQRRYDEAVLRYEKAASILVKAGGANQRDVIAILDNLSRALNEAGRTSDFDEIRARILKQ